MCRFQHLRKTHAAINVFTVAARAGVQRKTIYKQHDLVAVIDQYRCHPTPAALAATGRETASSPPSGLNSPRRTPRPEPSKQKCANMNRRSPLYRQLDSRSP
jgi:hypothetical protein